MGYPKVSVMFVSYNHALYIKKALDSVLNQTYQDFEVILSDDSSSDNTREVLADVNDERVYMHFFDENQGATINEKYVWQNCHGEYIALINSDDIWLPQHLEKSVNYLEQHDQCAAVFSWAALIDENDKVIDPCFEVFKQPNRSQSQWVYHLFTKGNCLCHPSMVIRREVYETVGFYKLGFRQLPDFNMWTRMVEKYPLYILEEVLVHHRRFIKTGENTSSPIVTNSVRDVNESLYTLLHYFDHMDDELFCDAFRNEFRNKQAQTHNELLCEKFFLMYDEKYYMHQISKFGSFLFLHDIYDKEGIYELLKENYGFSLKDFHELGLCQDLLGLLLPAEKKEIIQEKIINKSDTENCIKKIWNRLMRRL